MSIRSKSKISVSFSMSGMTDIVFLLLIFFMLTSTLIAPNALKLLMPQGGQTVTTTNKIPEIRVNAQGNIWLDGKAVNLGELENLLAQKLAGQTDPAVTLISDRGASVKENVGIMNIAKKRSYKVVLKENQ